MIVNKVYLEETPSPFGKGWRVAHFSSNSDRIIISALEGRTDYYTYYGTICEMEIDFIGDGNVNRVENHYYIAGRYGELLVESEI